MVLHEEGGKFFRDRGARSFDPRRATSRDPARILILDPVVGSRFALAKVVAQPGLLAETASSTDEARERLARGGVALILVDDDLGGETRGLDFLIEVRGSYPGVRRALVVAEDSAELRREEVAKAGLAFLLSKPWNPAFLRSAVRESIALQEDFAAWEHRTPIASTRRPGSGRSEPDEAIDRRIDVLARGLLAGLNSCEADAEVFELLHAEMAETIDSQRWLWVQEDGGLATRIVGDWPLESGIRLDSLPSDERALIEHARQSSRIARVDRRQAESSASSDPSACIGMTVKDGGRRVITALVWVAAEHCLPVLALLREIQAGLQLAFRRIREAEARALAARRLARRVSDELRTPVGALSHAIDRLRGEAVRAGMSTEWVDRVSSESERLVRAVERFDEEIGAESSEKLVVAN